MRPFDNENSWLKTDLLIYFSFLIWKTFSVRWNTDSTCTGCQITAFRWTWKCSGFHTSNAAVDEGKLNQCSAELGCLAAGGKEGRKGRNHNYKV